MAISGHCKNMATGIRGSSKKFPIVLKLFILIFKRSYAHACAAYTDRQNNHVSVIPLAINLTFIRLQKAVLGVGYDCYCSGRVCFCKMAMIGVNSTSQLPINFNCV